MKIGTIEDVHHTEVNAIAYSPDGTRLIGGSQNGFISVWDCGDINGEISLIRDRSLQRKMISALKFSPDSKEFISGSYDGTIIKFNRDGGMLNKPICIGKSLGINSLDYSFNGKKIVAGFDANGYLAIVDRDKFEVMDKFPFSHNGSVNAVACAPNKNEFISAADDGIIMRWDLDKHKSIGDPIDFDMDMISKLKYSNDGREFVAGDFNGCIVKVDARTGKLIKKIRKAHDSVITGLKYSPDGKELVSISADHNINLWDARTLIRRESINTGKTNTHSSIDYKPNGKEFVVGNIDGSIFRYKGNILRDIEKKKVIREIGFEL